MAACKHEIVKPDGYIGCALEGPGADCPASFVRGYAKICDCYEEEGAPMTPGLKYYRLPDGEVCVVDDPGLISPGGAIPLLTEQVNGLRAENAAKDGRIAELEAALRPFVETGNEAFGLTDQYLDREIVMIMRSDWVKARDALEKTETP